MKVQIVTRRTEYTWTNGQWQPTFKTVEEREERYDGQDERRHPNACITGGYANPNSQE
jgi:hypothetical protein